MNFKIFDKQDYLVAQVLADFDKDEYQMLESEIMSRLENDSFEKLKGCVFDFQQKSYVDQPFIRLITMVLTYARKQNKKTILLNLPIESERFVKSAGIDIEICKNESDLFKTGSQKASINMDFINPFLEATINTLKVQAATECFSEEAFLAGSKKIKVDIVGIIGVSSKEFNGSIALCFPTETFLSIMENMMGEEYQEIDDELEDGAGELLNIIFGQAKIALNAKDFSIAKAIPSVIRGKELKIKHLTQSPGIILPFESGSGDFHVAIGLKQGE
ncbi:MAG: chemotaxis protein CheX [Bacteriovoracaceae bacterium]